MTTIQRPRGRPVTGCAKSPARRMKEMRQRTITLVNDTDDTLEFSPASGLFEALRVCYQQGRTWEVACICNELIARLNADPGATLRLKAEFTRF